MNMRALVPFQDRQGMARSDLNLFGSLQREIDRLFDDFARGFGALAVPATEASCPAWISAKPTRNSL